MNELKDQIKEDCFFILALIHRQELSSVDAQAIQDSLVSLLGRTQELKERLAADGL